MDLKQFSREFLEVYRLKEPPGDSYLKDLTRRTLSVLEGETTQRPPDTQGRAGGVVELHRDRATLVVPDIHARRDFLLHLLMFRDAEGITVAEKMAAGRLQIVCVGDGFHAEGRAAGRWKKAFQEYVTRYKRRKAMDQEMTESLGLMGLVMLLKNHFPDQFHFLKGNHENILNENSGGNRSFGKFAYEGEMVKVYMEEFFRRETLDLYYQFEHALPLLAEGDHFLVTHAEPARFHSREEIINYRDNPETVYDLTWTDDGAAEEGSVTALLQTFLGPRFDEKAYLIGGHRPVKGLYRLRAGGRYVQIHNPRKYITAVVRTGRTLDPEKNIIEIRPQPEIMLQRLEDLTR